MYLSYDPGETTGWVRFNNEGALVESGQVTGLDDLIDHIGRMKIEHIDDPIKVVIYEDYIVFKKKAAAHTGSRVVTAQAIGIIKTLKDTGCEFVCQPSNIKSIAQKWTGVKPPADHSQSHWVDAFNHGAYYLIQRGLRRTQLEIEMEGNAI